MARETKVGLLAGLAFIICFAIILANRSGQGRIAQQMPSFVKQTPTSNSNGRRSANRQSMNGQSSNGQRTSPASSQRPANNAQGYGQRPRNEVASNRSRKSDPRVLQGTNAGSASGRDRNRQPLRRENDASGGARRDDVPQGHATQQATPQSTQSLTQQSNPSPGTTSPAKGFVPRVSAKDRAAFVAATGSSAKPPAKAVSGRKHRVRDGDTLTQIANEHYGSRSVKLVSALYEANHSVMSSPDKLIVGRELLLPNIVAGFKFSDKRSSKKSSPVTAKPARAGAKPKKDSATRWYQINENDRYETIARRELKDAKRWREIYELNKKIFPDPNRIQSGVRIRLPVVKVADARARRR